MYWNDFFLLPPSIRSLYYSQTQNVSTFIEWKFLWVKMQSFHWWKIFFLLLPLIDFSLGFLWHTRRTILPFSFRLFHAITFHKVCSRGKKDKRRKKEDEKNEGWKKGENVVKKWETKEKLFSSSIPMKVFHGARIVFFSFSSLLSHTLCHSWNYDDEINEKMTTDEKAEEESKENFDESKESVIQNENKRWWNDDDSLQLQKTIQHRYRNRNIMSKVHRQNGNDKRFSSIFSSFHFVVRSFAIILSQPITLLSSLAILLAVIYIYWQSVSAVIIMMEALGVCFSTIPSDTLIVSIVKSLIKLVGKLWASSHPSWHLIDSSLLTLDLSGARRRSNFTSHIFHAALNIFVVHSMVRLRTGNDKLSLCWLMILKDEKKYIF